MIYYLSKILGDGLSRATTWDSRVALYGVSHVTMIGRDSVTGLPIFDWALAAVPNGTDTSGIDADTTIDKLPITSLDQTIGSLTPQQRKQIQDLGTKYAVPAVSGLTIQSTCRDALNAFGHAQSATFDANSFSAV